MSQTPPKETSDGKPQNDHKDSGFKHTLYIVASIVLAILFALILPDAAAAMHVGGEIFLNLLMMIVVPLVMASVMSGILGLGDVRKLGKPGGYAILYYLSTTLLAVFVGLVVVNLFNPGKSVSKDQLDSSAGKSEKIVEYQEKKEARENAEIALATAEKSQSAAQKNLDLAKDALAKSPEDASLVAARDQALESIKKADIAHTKAKAELAKYEEDHSMGAVFNNLTMMLFTKNLFKSASEMELLPLIVFSIVFAGMLTTLGERVDNITRIIDQANHALMAFVMLLMKIAPLGIFCLVTSKLGDAIAKGGLWGIFTSLGWFILTVLTGLAFHAFVTLPLIYWIFTRKNPYRFMLQMSQALLTAFSTSSSSATLPVTMETAIDQAGVSRRSAEFVLPLGATVNMDGTALYEAAAAIFIAQALMFNYPNDPQYALDAGTQVKVAVTATLAAIGAAGIPEAGLITMLIVFNAVKLPPEYIALILPVDWFLDRFRTAVNCFGDSVGAAVVDRSFEPEPRESPPIVTPTPATETS